MMKRFFGRVTVGLWIMVVCVGWGFQVMAATPLANSDCEKCHSKEVQDVDARGGLHKTAVSCLDCHLEHPPAGKNAIPECALCHDPKAKPHYGIENCITCHYPHYPMEMNLSSLENAKSICCTCHAPECGQLDTYPSKHTALDCKECHLEHRQYQQCLECHQPHTSDMKYEDCLRCHNPHMAAVVKYGSDIPNHYCGGCHGKEVGVLAANTTKHHDLACVYCHKDQHKTVPPCTACHGTPHSPDIHGKFPNCKDCHNDPHGLTK